MRSLWSMSWTRMVAQLMRVRGTAPHERVRGLHSDIER